MESVFNLNLDFIMLLEGADGLKLEVLLVCGIEILHKKPYLILFDGSVSNVGGFSSASSKEGCEVFLLPLLSDLEFSFGHGKLKTLLVLGT